jgi:hypothetical protein
MNADLESIVAVDEEARSRLTSVEKRLQHELEAARAQRDRAQEQRLTAARDALDHEIAAIDAAGEAELGRLRDQHAAHLRLVREAAEGELERAAERFADIIRNGPPEEGD